MKQSYLRGMVTFVMWLSLENGSSDGVGVMSESQCGLDIGLESF